MKVLITGATGNVGTALLDVLCADAQVTEIRGLARRLPDAQWSKTTFTSVDVASDDLRSHVADADAVVHLAWLFQPTHQPEVTWAANVGGSARVFDAAARAGVNALVYLSSVGAYSPADGSEITEDWPTNGLPTAAYGREKAAVERILDAVEAGHPEMRVVRFRPGFMFQERSGPQQRRLFAGPLLPASLLQAGRLPIVPFPTGLRFQALATHDAARAVQLALGSTVRGAFNLAADPVVDGAVLAAVLGGRPVPVPPPLVRAALSLGWHASLVPAEPSLFDLAMRLPILRTDRANHELGWSPTTSATDALAAAIAGMRGGGGGTGPLAPDHLVDRLRHLVQGVGRR